MTDQADPTPTTSVEALEPPPTDEIVKLALRKVKDP